MNNMTAATIAILFVFALFSGMIIFLTYKIGKANKKLINKTD